jgi:2-succinyl-6-hydroxy-2,4-cyclohexadiene-1-carboxylate synthase
LPSRAVLYFLHGFAGTPAAWDDVAIEGARLVLPVAASWDATLAAIKVAPDAIVVGYSLGARLALGLLAQDRIRAAVLVSVNPGLADPAARVARRADDARWATFLRTRGIDAFADAWEAQPLFATQARADPTRLAKRRAARRALDPETLARQLETTGLAEMPDLAPTLRVRATRAHLITGADDAKFTAIARSLGLPHDTIPDCGHDPTLESPSPLTHLITRAIARW